MASVARALVAPSVHGPLEFQTVRLSELRPDEALVQIQAVGICHADVACLHGKLPVQYPNVFGHEGWFLLGPYSRILLLIMAHTGAGFVKKLGERVVDIEVNDTVLLSYNSCGTCDLCKQGHAAYCESWWDLNFGGQRLDQSHTMSTAEGTSLYSNFFGQSSFSSIAVVNRRCMIKVPAHIPLELFAPLGCGMQTGAGAIFNALHVQPGETVAVFGTGSVGMAAIMAAKIRKARTIIGVDISKKRLEVAQGLGATHTLQGSVDDVSLQIKAICDGKGVNHAVDTTGVPVMIEQMINCLGIMGKAVSIGAPAPGAQVRVDVISHLTMGRQYMGNNQGDSIPQTV